MKKLLYILILPLTLFLVSCGGGGSDDLQPVTPSLEETLVGKKWCLSNNDQDGFILSEDGNLLITQKCNPHTLLGEWIIEDSSIIYSYINNSIQTTALFAEITEYSENEVKILLNSSSTVINEAVYSLTPDDIYGCMDPGSSNYNPLANCDDDNCSSDWIYFPDANFKAALVADPDVNLNGDNEISINEAVNVNGDFILDVRNSNISDLTGIEHFRNLRILWCDGNQLTSLDLSQNHYIEDLACYNNQLTSINLSTQTHNYSFGQYTSLAVIDCRDNQLTSLDFSMHGQLWILDCRNNQLTSLNLKNGNNFYIFSRRSSNNPDLYCIKTDWYGYANWPPPTDPQQYYYTSCP